MPLSFYVTHVDEQKFSAYHQLSKTSQVQQNMKMSHFINQHWHKNIKLTFLLCKLYHTYHPKFVSCVHKTQEYNLLYAGKGKEWTDRVSGVCVCISTVFCRDLCKDKVTQVDGCVRYEG